MLNRIRKQYNLRMNLRKFRSQMLPGHPFENFRLKNLGDCSASPKEFFSHYEAFGFWLAKKLADMGDRKEILDLGNRKLSNAVNSVYHGVSALVLMDCEDRLSNVKYYIHDISHKLPFENARFDCFTSLGSLQLVGLGRYGDKLDPYTLLNFIGELDRVMKPKSDLIFSTTYGHNCLNFNNGYVFDLPTLKNIFSAWVLHDHLIDNNSTPSPKPYEERYTRDLSLQGYEEGDLRIIFLHFRRGYN